MKLIKTHKIFIAIAAVALTLGSCNSTKHDAKVATQDEEKSVAPPAKEEPIKETAKQEGAEVIDVTLADYNEITSSPSFVVVDFHATWCRPCKQMAPHLDKIKSENSADVFKLVKIDVDKNKEISAHFGIESIPTLKLYKDGKEVNTTVGGLNEAQLRELFKQHM